MNIPLTAEGDNDLSSNSSWSVISDSEDFQNSCEGKNALNCDSSNFDNNTDEHFFDIVQNESHGATEESENDTMAFDELIKFKEALFQNIPNGVRLKIKGLRKNKRDDKTEKLSLLSIAASVLTITGLTFLCMLFPQNIERDVLQKVQNTFVNSMAAKNASTHNYLNKTTELFDIANEANLLSKLKDSISSDDRFINEDECSIDEESDDLSLHEDVNFESLPLNFGPLPRYEASVISNLDLIKTNAEPSTPYDSVQNKTLGLIQNVKRVLMNPNLQIFVCTVLQDICLIKLVNQLNEQQLKDTSNSNTSFTEKTKSESTKKQKKNKLNSSSKQKPKTRKKLLKSKTKDNNTKKADKDIINDFTQSSMLNEENSYAKIELGNKIGLEYPTKSECEKQFEELDIKWEAAGQNHRHKIQEIKENFRNELLRIKENEKENASRRQKIQTLREKYVERLKLDREKYLYQLHNFREERQKILQRLCHKKSSDKYLKDASVGNYAVLLPESYNFQQKIELLQNHDHESRISLPSNPTDSFPKLGAVKNSKFIKHQSIQNISKDNQIENTSRTLDLTRMKREKYLEKVRKYYEHKNRYLLKRDSENKEKNKKFSNTTETAEIIGEAIIEDIMSHMTTNKSLCRAQSNASMEIIESKENDKFLYPSAVNTAENQVQMKLSDQKLKLVAKRKPRDRDPYDLAFDDKSKKVKQEDVLKWNMERREKLNRSQQQIVSKQDPQKSYKEKIVLKGHM